MSPHEHAASEDLQKAIAAFVRNSAAGLQLEPGWPVCDLAGEALVELLASNLTNATFMNPERHGHACVNPPRVRLSEAHD